MPYSPFGKAGGTPAGAGNVVYVKFKDKVLPWLADAGYMLEQDIITILKVLFKENLWVQDPALEKSVPNQSSRSAYYYPNSIGYGKGVLRRRRRFKVVPLNRPLASLNNPQHAGIGDADPTPAFEIVELT